MNDEFYMNLAIAKAWKYQLLTYPNPAVGCLILSKNKEILSIEAHEKAGAMHAELSAIKSALVSQNPALEAEFSRLEPSALYDKILAEFDGYFAGATAYVTLEPCAHFGRTPPCANLLVRLGFSVVCCGLSDHTPNAKGGAQILKQGSTLVKFGVCEKACKDLIAPFLAWNSGNFAFFKIAMSANGVISGGLITSDAARAHMHEIRALIDLLIIGGNSVRTDRPILDSRLSRSKRPPNVLIYSRGAEFDREIPLFKIKGREVVISDSLNSAKSAKFTMIEGGANLLNSLKNRVKYLLIYRSNEFLDRENARLSLNFRVIYELNFDDYALLWCEITD